MGAEPRAALLSLAMPPSMEVVDVDALLDGLLALAANHRVAVIGGGCSGLQYKMDLVDGPANRDIMVQSSNVRVVVDPKSALFVSGSLLDYSDDLQKGGFKVTNPNAVAHCSCGESFTA